MEYIRPFLYPKQERAFFRDSRYIFCEASTKAGKTVGAIAWILEQAFAGSVGKNYWWVAPINQQADIAYRRICQRLSPGSFTKKDSPTPVVTLVNGAAIWFKSGDNPDSLYGEDVYAAVVDEASRCKEESWHALRSTVTATTAPIRLIGNVKGRRNWFYKLARKAQAGDLPNALYEKITVLDAIEAGVIPPEEIEDARRMFPEHVFRELYMAEAADDGGNPFGLDHIEACTVDSLSSRPPVGFGIDLAKKHDWLVVMGLDADGRVCVFKRWQGVPWRESIRRIHDIVGDDVPALVDSTGLGDPILEELQYGHGNFEGYHFSLTSKQRLMEGLAVSIQGHEIQFPAGPIADELEAFEYQVIPTGVRYNAPEGEHDDCVCGLALAREIWSRTAPAASLIQFYVGEAKKAKLRQSIGEVEATSDVGKELAKELQSLSFAEKLDNELTELYNKTVSEYLPEAHKCHRCSQEIAGPTRVSDGMYVWHQECFA